MTTVVNVPFLDSGEIKSHLAVGEGFLIQVSSISSDECRHVIAYIEKYICNMSESAQKKKQKKEDSKFKYIFCKFPLSQDSPREITSNLTVERDIMPTKFNFLCI